MPAPGPKQNQAGGPDLDQYLRSPRPTSWLVLGLVVLVLAMGIVWGFLGTMKTTVPVTGIKDGAHFTGYLPPANSLSLTAGLPVDYEGEQVGMLVSRGTVAYTSQEIVEEIDNHYFASQLALNPYNVVVTVDMDPDACSDGVVTLEIVVAQTRPFDYLMG